VRDVPGEWCENPERTARHIPQIRDARVVWLFASVSELLSNPNVNELGNRWNQYGEALNIVQGRDPDLRRLQVVVVYTFADRMIGPGGAWNTDQWEGIGRYLQDDPLKHLVAWKTSGGRNITHKSGPIEFPDLSAYNRALLRNSAMLAEFTKTALPGSRMFADQVEQDTGRAPIFTAISATGGDTTLSTGPEGESQRHDTSWARLRVLDPWFATLEFRDQSTPTLDSVLIIDPEWSAAHIREAYSRMPGMSPRGYLVGDRREVNLRVSNTEELDKRREDTMQACRLIGPLLSRARNAKRVVVLAKSPIIDLADFSGTAWESRLTVISESREAGGDWAKCDLIGKNATPADVRAAVVRAAAEPAAIDDDF
jgi:hypothetical protein